MSRVRSDSASTDVVAGIDRRDHVAVITGASSGLGAETARCLASTGCHVVMLGRDGDKLRASRDLVLEQLASASVEIHPLDLADLADVRRIARRLGDAHPRIHLLINNAGIMACPLGHTAQGYELQLGTNHLGHFLLAHLLLPSLLAAGRPGRAARVVTLSSGGHHLSAMDFEDPHFQRRAYDKWVAYGQSKTANVLFSIALDARYRERNVRAFAVHPGAVQTGLDRYMEAADRAFIQASVDAGRMSYKSIPQGAATTLWAATAPELEGLGGLYLEDCGIAELTEAGAATGVAPHAVDATAAERLWQCSEQWCEPYL